MIIKLYKQMLHKLNLSIPSINKKIWSVALAEWEITDQVFCLAAAICIAKEKILARIYKLMIAGEDSEVVNELHHRFSCCQDFAHQL